MPRNGHWAPAAPNYIRTCVLGPSSTWALAGSRKLKTAPPVFVMLLAAFWSLVPGALGFESITAAAVQRRLVSGEDVFREIDLLRGLRDAAAREEVKLVEQVWVAVVEAHIEWGREHALEEGAKIPLLHRHEDRRDKSRGLGEAAPRRQPPGPNFRGEVGRWAAEGALEPASGRGGAAGRANEARRVQVSARSTYVSDSRLRGWSVNGRGLRWVGKEFEVEGGRKWVFVGRGRWRDSGHCVE